MLPNAFAPFQELFTQLSPFIDASADGSHDQSHLARVWRTAQHISATEGGEPKLLAAAAILHDCVAVEKNSPRRAQASRLSAEKARHILAKLEWSAPEITAVADAIAAHSYSAGLKPTNIEGRILQDADRLDAIGFVGIARCFYTAGRMGSRLYNPEDPRGETRVRNDTENALDHFPLKLLHLTTGFQTETGMQIALQRHSRLEAFYEGFLNEIDG